MFWTILLSILFVLAAAALVWLLLKKWRRLKIIDPSTAAESQSKILKYQIFRKRVERAGGKHLKRVQSQVVRPVGASVQNLIRRVAGKLTAVERRYQEKKQNGSSVVYDKEMLGSLIEEGKKLMEEEHWELAEKKLITVISHDAKNINAYEYLGRLYLYKKDFELAKQTFEFLKKLSPEDPSVIASLGEVEERLGNHERAHQYFKEALDLSPKNPKYLDFYIEACIEEKNLHEAQSALDRLAVVNPENKKIELFEKKIKELRRILLR
ncbi:tetratricopeptide repeat protein [Patescibacteria group bacterium]|nr:tetratricopeptide repeat protein [Patescibacteria group bacterium]